MGARWVDSALGRWLSPDTIVPNPSNPQLLNRYSYVAGNPLRFRDPSGHMFVDDGENCFKPYYHYYAQQAGLEPLPTPSPLESLVVDFIPVVGDAKGVTEVFTGTDLITGEELGNWRYAGLFGLVGLAEVRLLRHAGEGGALLRVLKVADTVGATGQWHHIFSTKITRALDQHPTLKGIFERNGFFLRALNKADHKGYQQWHRAYDREVVRWLTNNPYATEKEFLAYLLELYSDPDMAKRFPGGEDLLKQTIAALEEEIAQ